jgi:hypothetical protein
VKHFDLLLIVVIEVLVKISVVGVEAGLSVGRAARPPDTPDRPSRPPDKSQTGID